MSVKSTYDLIKKRLFQKQREVSFITFDLKQKVFEDAVNKDDMPTMKKLIDLSDKQRSRRIQKIK